MKCGGHQRYANVNKWREDHIRLRGSVTEFHFDNELTAARHQKEREELIESLKNSPCLIFRKDRTQTLVKRGDGVEIKGPLLPLMKRTRTEIG